MAGWVSLDGSHGEGGGQILRTALALSALSGRPFELFNLRANRPRPGLAAQHLAAVQAIVEICGAQVEGAALGSQVLRIEPGAVRAGAYVFDVARVRASAGSATLVAQTVIPPLLFAPASSTVVLRGGTHVPWSPPYHYLEQVFLPVIGDLGGTVFAHLQRPGWYPQGGGELELEVHPCAGLEPVNLEHADHWRWEGLSAICGLPHHVMQRQAESAGKVLSAGGVKAHIRSEVWEGPGLGSLCFLVGRSRQARAGFSSLGEKGKSAEKVGAEAARALLDHLRRSGVLEEWLADQVLLYLALAHGASVFTTSRISRHLLTNAWVIQHFLPVRFEIAGAEGEPGRVSIEGVGFVPGMEV